MGFVACMGAAEINAISLTEVRGKVWEDNIKLFLNTRGSKLNLDLSASGEGPTMGFCERGNEILVSTNSTYF